MKEVRLTVNTDSVIGKISPFIYGHFAEHIGGVIYDGIWVGRDSEIANINGFRKDIVEALRKISPSVIRWPGGCFAETYDWRDGIGKERPVRPSWWTFQDGIYETNEFGTHEFMEFCSLVGAEPYLAINVTSLTPKDARDWIDYCNSPRGTTSLAKLREEHGSPDPFGVRFFGIGNENWGGGGTMTSEQYALEYRKYATVVRNIAPSAKIVAAAANYHSESWTSVFLSSLEESYGTPVPIDAISLHYYASGGLDADFSEEHFNKSILNAQKMDELIKRLYEILCATKRENDVRLYIDEWGAMLKTEEAKKRNQLFRQVATMRDGLLAAITLNIFNNHSYTVEMANVAQVANCLQSIFLTDKKKCILTPTYHVFDMYKSHQGATAVKCDISDKSAVSASASLCDNQLLITLANLSYSEGAEIRLCLENLVKSAEITLLSSEKPSDFNDFDAPDRVSPDRYVIDISKPFSLPPASVAAISVKTGEAAL